MGNEEWGGEDVQVQGMEGDRSAAGLFVVVSN